MNTLKVHQWYVVKTVLIITQFCNPFAISSKSSQAIGTVCHGDHVDAAVPAVDGSLHLGKDVSRTTVAVYVAVRVAVTKVLLARLGVAVQTVCRLDGLAADGVARVAGVDVGVEALAVAGEALDDLLVPPEGLAHLVVRHVVEEDALAHGADGNGGPEFAVPRLQDGRRGFLEEGTIKLGVVHGQACPGKELQEANVVLGVE